MTRDPIDDLPPVLTVQLVADFLDQSAKTVRGHIRRRELRAVKHGNVLYVRREWVAAFLDDPTAGDEPVSA